MKPETMVIVISRNTYEELKKKGINIDKEIEEGKVRVKNG